MSDCDPKHPALHFDSVSVALGGRRVLLDVTADVPPERVTVIAGPSGAGKTTLLRLCNRLTVPDQGRVLLHGTDTATLDPLSLRREVGMVFQTPVLLPGTVRDNLHVADPNADEERCATALRRVRLDERFLDRRGAELSGGEVQRACLARTLITRPRILLADEPTSALDPSPKLAFERLARDLASGGLTVVWVTHDLEQLRRLADHVLVLIDGCLRYQGGPAQLDRQPQLAAFLEGETDGRS